jgi:hypothetical protein
MNFTNHAGPENIIVGLGSVCQCCGSSFSKEERDPVAFNGLVGINVFPSPTPITTETDEYWTESIPIGDEFLVVRHRKQQDGDFDPIEEDEDEDN